MKYALMAVAAVSTLAFAGAASAQTYRDGGYWNGGYRDASRNAYRADRDQGQILEMRIQQSVQRGDLNWREGRDLQARVDGVQRLQWRYSRDGLSPWEANDIARRYDDIRARLRFERNDGDRFDGQRYGQGYGWR